MLRKKLLPLNKRLKTLFVVQCLMLPSIQIWPFSKKLFSLSFSRRL